MYLLVEALITTPLHPEWSGAALVDERGRLVGVGSLFLQEQSGETEVRGNMFVPVDALAPIEGDLVDQALTWQSRRHEIIAGNVANLDSRITPGRI